MSSYAGYDDPTGVPSPPSSLIYRGDVVTQQEAEDAGGIGASPTSLWVPAGALGGIGGSPALADLGGTGVLHAAWLFDAAGTETVGGQIDLSGVDWATFDVKMFWTNPGAGTGDVFWQLRYQFYGDTDTLASGSPVNSTITAPAQYVVKASTVGSGLTRTASKVLGFRMQRAGGQAADTLANDAALLGLNLTKAS